MVIGVGVMTGISLRTEKIFGEVVIAPLFAVTAVKLQVAKLKISIKHRGCRGLAGEGAGFCAARNGAAYLHGQYGFTGVGAGKKEAKLVLVPEFAEEYFGCRLPVAKFHPAVPGKNGKQSAGGVGVRWRRYPSFVSFGRAISYPVSIGAQLVYNFGAFGRMVVVGHLFNVYGGEAYGS